jgi:hypothetical protein
MADTVSFNLTITDGLSDIRPIAGGQPIPYTGGQPLTINWGTGNGANTAPLGADTVYGPITLTLLHGTPQTLTFSSGGGLVTNQNVAVAAARFKAIKIWNVAANQSLSGGGVGNNAANITVTGDMLIGSGRPFSAGTITINNGMAIGLGCDNAGAGYTITSSSTDQIVLTNTDSTNTIAVVEISVVCPSS